MYISLDTVNNFIYEHFSNVKLSKSGTHFLARCALCGDSKISKSKRRFNLDYNNGAPVYHCFNCGRSGQFIKLYSEIKGVSLEEAKREFRKFDTNIIKKSFTKNKLKKSIVAKPNITYHDYILEDCISVDDKTDGFILPIFQKALKNFIRSRNTHNYKLYIAYKGKYKGRVIIPIYDNNNHIIFFQGRAFGKNYDKKYDNPPVEKSHIIVNDGKFDENKYIIISEGFFDALSIGNQGTSVLGASINDDFLKRIFTKTKTGVIIALDNDEKGIEETLKIINESKYSSKLKYFLMPKQFTNYNDINMLDGNVDNVYNFIIKNSYSKFEYYTKLSLRRKK